jgi:hypothetical protein
MPLPITTRERQAEGILLADGGKENRRVCNVGDRKSI